MQNCEQSKGQTILQHGESVQSYALHLIDILKDHSKADLQLPEWFFKYSEQILNKLFPIDIIKEYTLYHDCSKPFCKSIDANGKSHFNDHAILSEKIWLEVGGNPIAAKLMKMDMDIHLLKALDVNEFCSRPEAITLLIVGLAEIHSNASLFGGIDSISFKMKYKHINQRGKKICKQLFGGSNDVA